MAEKGQNFRIAVGANNVQGLNDGSITINGETIDVTTFLSGGWVEKIQGLKSAEISMSGFYLDDDTNGQVALRNALINGTELTMTVTVDGTNGWTGDFLVKSFDGSASVADAVNTSISLESTGAITATP